MKTVYLSLVLGLLFACYPNQSSHAQDKPSTEVAKSFLDFYFKGQGKGVVVADMQVCADVVNAACVDPVDPSLLLVGMKYKIWMAFVVPEGDEVDSLSLQFSKDSETKFSRDLSVKGSIRYRTWRSFNPTAPGIWTVSVLDNREVELEELGKLSLVVSE
ncbi:MAG: hypothetical protein AAF564_23045 [Bacteroidota bacterium]